ncbi:MAG: GHKL domain-containing protein [Ruthenibacterium sp.]
MMLQTTIALPGEIPVENVQLCSIFSNLLDNAIRAVKPLAQEMRKITVKANLRGQTLFVKVENPCDSALSQKGTGYGLQILRDIAAQYHGAVMTTEENGVFTAVVTLEL